MPEQIARHLLEADPLGQGAEAALAAGDSLAARFAFDEAAAMYRRALAGADAERRSEVHERLAKVLEASGDLVGAVRHLGLAKKETGPERRRVLRSKVVRLLLQRGKLPAAERLCQAMLEGAELSTRCTDLQAQAWADHAEVLFLRGRFAEARTLCERALSFLSCRLPLALNLRTVLARSLFALGSFDESERAYAVNETTAQEAGLVRETARALIGQGAVAHRLGEGERAVALYRRGLELSSAARSRSAVAYMNLGSLFASAGDFEPAIENLSKALAAFTRVRQPKETAHAALNLARVQLFIGELERADELCRHARSLAEQTGDAYLRASSRLVQGEILEAKGSVAEAAQEMSGACEELERLDSPRYAAEGALLLARVHLARGERALVRSALAAETLLEVARTTPSIAAERDLLAAELALATGDTQEASRRLLRAQAVVEEESGEESCFFEARVRVHSLLAQLRDALGDVAGAAVEAGKAARALDQLVAKVPTASRGSFLRHPRRAEVLVRASRREPVPAVRGECSAPHAEAPGRSHALIGKAPALQKVLKVIDAVARANVSVLIRGESGTGKELLAEAVHRGSARKDMPLVKVNCAAMVEELLLSELFGHERGAFTGAVRERKGRFELADGGTIFLDEIGDISPKAQVALLRVLQEHEFERVGGQKTIRVDVRVICATNRDLEGMIAAGSFRQDLYYRLKGVMLELPPLRDRGEDLPELCDHLLGRFAKERGEEKKTLSPEAIELLRSHDWPGNVRELENVLSSASIFAEGRIITPSAFENIGELAPLLARMDQADDDEKALPMSGTLSAGPLDYYQLARARGISLKDLRNEMEVQCISKALQEARGNISEAARLLQMKRSRLSQIVNADPQLRGIANGD